MVSTAFWQSAEQKNRWNIFGWTVPFSRGGWGQMLALQLLTQSLWTLGRQTVACWELLTLRRSCRFESCGKTQNQNKSKKNPKQLLSGNVWGKDEEASVKRWNHRLRLGCNSSPTVFLGAESLDATRGSAHPVIKEVRLGYTQEDNYDTGFIFLWKILRLSVV